VIAKALELRDEGTFIALLAVDMNPPVPGFIRPGEVPQNQIYLLRRCGYPCDGRPNIVITHMSADGRPASNDPYSWGGRTYPVAHKYIIDHWNELKDGDVVDVQFILGETKQPKTSERLTCPV
jgi:hypothetical protein